MLNAISTITGQGGTGTGFNWRQNYDDGQQFEDLRKRFNVSY